MTPLSLLYHSVAGFLFFQRFGWKCKEGWRLLCSKLEKLPHVKEVRHQGLLVGVEFDDTIGGVDVKHGCLDRHLLITAIGAHIIRMIPPLIVTEEECDKAVAIIEDTIKSLSRSSFTSASAAAQLTGCPPNVVPWEPAVKAFATSAVAQMAPIGIPPPRAFAIDTISGLIP